MHRLSILWPIADGDSDKKIHFMCKVNLSPDSNGRKVNRLQLMQSHNCAIKITQYGFELCEADKKIVISQQ